MAGEIYLDHAAATPAADDVLAAMQPFFGRRFYNPSATYLAAKEVKTALEDARKAVAERLGARPAEITFTAGGSEANNLVIHGVMRRHAGKKLIVSAIEHDSVLAAGEAHGAIHAPVKPSGVIDIEALSSLIDEDTVLVSVMYANNEIGTVQPIRKLAALMEDVRAARRLAGNDTPLYLHSDAAQAANYLDLHVNRLGVDFLTLNGGKIYGPKQSGVVYVKAGVAIEPLVYGGGQEHGLRSGTENVAGAAGFAAALTSAQAMRHNETRRLQALQRQFLAGVAKNCPGATVNGSTDTRLPNNVHLTFPGADNERLLIQLEEKGILAAAGSACSASNDEPSHVLKAIGLSDADARGSIRFTMGRQTTAKDVEYVVSQLAQLLA